MSESRRVTSTARSIQRSWLWRLFKLYFWLDLLLAILAIGCFCFYEELSALEMCIRDRVNAEVLAAVNTDPEAPIFEHADYGIVQDCGAFLEKALAALQ